LVKVARGRLSPAATAKVVALGIPLEGKLQPDYPAEAWSQTGEVDDIRVKTLEGDACTYEIRRR
jgi:hypothetical protein